MSKSVFYRVQPRKFIATALFLCLCCQAKDKKPDVSSIVNSLVNWGDALNTAGATAELRPVHKEFKSGVHYSTYDIYISGVPRDQPYAVFQWPINQSEPSVVSGEVYVSADGRLCKRENECHDNTGPYLQMGFVSARGEPHRIVMISKDGKYKIATMAMPNPIVATDQGCRVEVLRGTPRFELAILRGEGFQAGEEVRYKSNSAGEIMNKKFKADAQGKFVLPLAPNVVGKDQGEDEVSFKAANCSPMVSYHWGEVN